MFEQSTLAFEKRPWTFGASLVLRSGLLSTLVALSIVYVESMPAPVMHLPLPYFRPPSPVKIVDVIRYGKAGGSSSIVRPFTAPVSISRGVPQFVDQPGAPEILTGIPSGVGVLGYASNGLAGPFQPAIAPPPPPAKPPAPKMQPAKPHPIGGHVLEAMIIRRVVPAYPMAAKSMRVSGTVKLMGVIARDGTVQQLQVLSGHPLLVSAALEAVKQWLYRPTLLNGEPVEVTAPIDVHFKLLQ